MRVFIDVNVLIDVLIQREPFFADSYKIIQLGLNGEIDTLMSAGSINNIYYVLRKSIKNADIAREKIFLLSNMIKICKSTPEDITHALVLFISDYEDAILAAAAKREKADYIITRDETDFENSPVPAVSPAQFIERFFPA